MMSALPESEATPSADATASLEDRVAELERELRMTNAVIDALPQGVYWKDIDLRFRGCNKIGREAIGFNDMSFIGRTDFDLWSREQAETFVKDDREVLADRRPRPSVVTSARDMQGEPHWVENAKLPVFGDSGELLGVVGIFRDVTEQKLAEQAMQAEQRATVLRMSTPMLPVADGVVVLPLIGSLDPDRAEQVMQALLAGVVEHRASTAILDITGLQTVDTSAAEALVRAARAIRLLGAEAIVTGVRPAVAQTLVALGTELGDLVVLGDLKAGIRHALARRTGRAG